MKLAADGQSGFMVGSGAPRVSRAATSPVREHRPVYVGRTRWRQEARYRTPSPSVGRETAGEANYIWRAK